MSSVELSAVEWLGQQVPSFGALTVDERKAISDFSMMWTYFESVVCGRDGNANKLAGAVNRWQDAGVLTDTAFAGQLAYFQSRYTSNGSITPRFDGLRLAPTHRKSVEDVMTGQTINADDIARALLMIVFRLRNNLFHGEKWQYGIADQIDNFTHAIAIMRMAIELNGKCP